MKVLMLKRFIAVLVSVLMLVSLAACGGGAETNVDISKLSPALLDGLDWQEELMEVTSDSVLTNYYLVDTSDISYFALYRSSSGATAEEIAIFEAVDADAAGRIADAVSTRIEDMKFSFENYIPAEMAKIESAVVYTKGCYVVFVTNNDDAAAMELVEDFFG